MITVTNLLSKVESLFTKNFAGSQVLLGQVSGDDDVSGYLLWDGFFDLTMLDRQRNISDLLRQELSPEEQRNVSVVFALTPDEYHFIKEENARS